MSTYQKANGEVIEKANSILKKFESHQPLLENKVAIDFVMAYGERDDDGNKVGDALTKNGLRAFGITRKLPLKDRAMGRGDAEIASEEMQDALLDHELHHIQVKSKKGQFCYDALGRPELKLRKHDVEIGWFAPIAARHGQHSIEQIQAKAIMDSLGQFFWPQLAPNIITGDGDLQSRIMQAQITQGKRGVSETAKVKK